MIFIISLIFALLFVALFYRALRRSPLPFYAAAVIVSVCVVIFTWSGTLFPAWFAIWIWPVFSRGALAGALFVLVMCTGALPDDTKAFRALMPIRGELSILACILTLGHNVAYGRTYFTALFIRPSEMPAPTLAAAVCSLVMIAIMIPLFITSFRRIRRKIKASDWKKLQRFAYLFYALLYAHIMLLAIPNAIRGRTGYALTIFVYSFVFIAYLLCRILKAVAKREKTNASLRKKQAGAALCSLVMSALILTAVVSIREATEAREELKAALESAAGTTTEAVDTTESTAGATAETAKEAADTTEETAPGATAEAVDTTESMAGATAETAKEAADTTEETAPGATAEAVDTTGPMAGVSAETAKEAADANEETAPGATAEATDTTGSTAGASAETAKETPDANEGENSAETDTSGKYIDGIYTGSAQGNHGTDADIEVEVTVEGGRITSIIITGFLDDEPYYSPSVEGASMISQMLENQSPYVDTVTGATETSEALIKAVASALRTARDK